MTIAEGMSAPLTPEERTALEMVIGPDARGAYHTAEEVWIAARAHYTAETERLREALHQIAANDCMVKQASDGPVIEVGEPQRIARAALAPDHSTPRED